MATMVLAKDNVAKLVKYPLAKHTYQLLKLGLAFAFGSGLLIVRNINPHGTFIWVLDQGLAVTGSFVKSGLRVRSDSC